MKKPTQQMGLERMLSKKVDTDTWGPQGVETVKKCDAMRERVREASKCAYTGFQPALLTSLAPCVTCLASSDR